MRVRIWALVTALVVVAAVFACARKAAVEKPPVQSVQPPSSPADVKGVAGVAAAPLPALLAEARARNSPSAVAVGGLAGRADASAFNTEAYDHIEDNRFRRVDADPLSTFLIDVDTASYANVRRFLSDGELPPAGAVRTEELINYFRFTYP